MSKLIRCVTGVLACVLLSPTVDAREYFPEKAPASFDAMADNASGGGTTKTSNGRGRKNNDPGTSTPPPSTGTGGNSQSPLGTNLTGIADWSTEWPFVDAFKASRPWISGSSTAWDDGRTLQVDQDGWVTALEPGQIARTLLFWEQTKYPAGTYVVLYDGEGSIQYFNAATLDASRSTAGRHVLQVDPARGGFGIFITATTAGNPIRNIRVIMPGGICEGNPFQHAADASACASPDAFRSFEANYASIVFHPKFLDRIRTYRLLRFMDWGKTNNSAQAAWAGRPRPEEARYTAKGVPVEVMVELANRVGAHAWFSLPHPADDDYMAQYARLVRQLLRTDLKAYVEYSNEVWNGQFAQAKYAQNQGLALGLSSNAFQAQLYFYSKRSVEMFDIWATEFGDPARLVRVMSAQAASSWTSTQVLDYQGAKLKTDALAVAPYFGSYLGAPGEQARVQALTLDQLFAELDSVAIPQAVGWMNAQQYEASARGVPLIAYEGGQHLAGYWGVENDAAVNVLFDAANRDPRMGTLYQKYLQAWKATGATLFVHFVNCAGYSKWGRWGSLEFLEQPRSLAPKFDALQTFIEQNPAWWGGL